MRNRAAFFAYWPWVFLLCVSYLVGLAAFFPEKWGVGWVRAVVPSSVQWQALTLDWRGARWQALALPMPGGGASVVLEEVRVHPVLSALLWGQLSADYHARFAGGYVEGLVRRAGDQVQVDWRMHVEDFTPFAALFSLPIPVTGRGEGEGGVVWDRASRMLSGGAWTFKAETVSLLDLALDTVNVQGNVPDLGQVALRLSGKGNVAVSGQLAVQGKGGLSGRLSGSLRIQPLAGRLPGAVGLALKGKPATLSFGGSLAKPAWKWMKK